MGERAHFKAEGTLHFRCVNTQSNFIVRSLALENTQSCVCVYMYVVVCVIGKVLLKSMSF